MESGKQILHVVSNTHWDREWRHPFQHMRMDLVEMMDRLLEICETEKDFKHYHLDSQTILLEDYVEIRPEKRALLEKHIKSGKVQVGPWYTLPDMFIVSAEAIVRNLQLGHRVARSFGKVMKVGYTPCSYGQTSQIAQIYKGFGIESIIFYRGIDAHGLKTSEYILEAADGTRILGIKLPIEFTRFNFRFNVFSKTMYKGDEAYDGKILFHNIGVGSEHSVFSLMHKNQPRTYTTKDITNGFRYAKSWVEDMATTPHLLLMDGFDASYPHPNTGYIIRDAKKFWPQDEVIHTSFPKFIKAIEASIDWDKLPVLKGEQRHPAIDTKGTSIMQGVLVSQAGFKRLNHDAQILVEKYVEPISALAWMAGCEYPQSFIDLAWKYILSNHGHDTICGPSVDQVYKDATYRLEQACLIADGMTDRSELGILGKISKRDFKEQYQTLTVFNPLQQTRSEVVAAFLDIPQAHKAETFRIEDFEGNPMPCEILGQEKVYGVDEDGDTAYSAVFVDRYKITFLAKDIPAMGYRCFKVFSHARPEKCERPAISAAVNTLENEFLKVSIHANGSFDISHKITGNVFRGLHYFEDGGDAGTPWYYIRPQNDRIVSTLNAAAGIERIENTTLAAAFRITIQLPVPALLTKDKSERVKEERNIRIITELRLTRTARWVAIHSEVETDVEDHRLRVAFPTGLQSNESWSESQFDAIARPIDYPVDSSGWVDTELGLQPQQNWLDLSDGQHGLAILNKGLRDFEVSQDKKRVIAITLLHGVRYPRIAGGANPWADDPYILSSQSRGKFVYDYAVMPHRGDWQTAGLYAASRAFNVPMRLAQCSSGLKVLNPARSFVKIDPDSLVLSALKLAESGKSLILRFFNPTEKKVAGTITLANEIRRVYEVSLEEKRLSGLELRDTHTLALAVAPKKIVTLEILLKRGMVGAYGMKTDMITGLTG